MILITLGSLSETGVDGSGDAGAEVKALVWSATGYCIVNERTMCEEEEEDRREAVVMVVVMEVEGGWRED